MQEETKKAVTRSSKNRTGVDAGVSADAEENLGDATLDSRRLSRGSKRRKTSCCLMPTHYRGWKVEEKGSRSVEKVREKVRRLTRTPGIARSAFL